MIMGTAIGTFVGADKVGPNGEMIQVSFLVDKKLTITTKPLAEFAQAFGCVCDECVEHEKNQQTPFWLAFDNTGSVSISFNRPRSY